MMRKRFCNTPAITGKAYPLMFPAGSANALYSHYASLYSRNCILMRTIDTLQAAP